MNAYSSLEEMLAHYHDEFTQLSVNLFYRRQEKLEAFYQGAFDNRPACLRFLQHPKLYGLGLGYTNQAIYLESRFALRSDLTISEDIDRRWSLLHPIVADKLSITQLDAMAAHNTEQRRRILACTQEGDKVMKAVARLHQAGHYNDAIKLADELVACIKHWFEKIVDSYDSLPC